MAPWMVIAALIGAGIIVLLVAPTIHRRINAKSRETAESSRIERAQVLRESPEGESTHFDTAAHAVTVRDRLLLRGVRAEIIRDGAKTALIYRSVDAPVVRALMDELDID